MSKWKCEICGKEFDNFHAQGFDNKIYCPLCFFKEENRRLKDKINTYENPEDLTLMFMYCDEKAKDKIKQLKEVIEEVREWLKYKAETLDEFDIPKRKETGAFWFSTRGEIDNLLQILDKGVKNVQGSMETS